MWIFIFEIGLMVVGYFASRYNYIFIPIIFVIFVFNIYAYIRQITSSYVITNNGIEINRKDQHSEIAFKHIVSIRETVLYYEVTHRIKKKVRTMYFSKLIKDFATFKNEVENNIRDQKVDVLFF